MSKKINVFWENRQKTCDLFSWKTSRKHTTILSGKTYFVFSRNTYKEIDNVFTKETVDIKINFFSLFPWKAMNKTGFLFWMQMDGIILLFFLSICLGNRLNVFLENIDFICFLTLFSKKTATIPSSIKGCA